MKHYERVEYEYKKKFPIFKKKKSGTQWKIFILGKHYHTGASRINFRAIIIP